MSSNSLLTEGTSPALTKVGSLWYVILDWWLVSQGSQPMIVYFQIHETKGEWNLVRTFKAAAQIRTLAWHPRLSGLIVGCANGDLIRIRLRKHLVNYAVN